MEKQGVITPGVTPPEDKDVKQASDASLESHPTQRLADHLGRVVAEKRLRQQEKAAKDKETHP